MKISVFIPTRGFPYCEVIWRLNQDGIPYTFMSGNVGWSITMNNAVNAFLESESDIFVSIDDDTIPPGGFLPALVAPIEEDAADIVGAPTVAVPQPGGLVIPNTFMMGVRDGVETYLPYIGQGVEPVDAVGSAVLAVHRKVFQKIKRPFSEELHKDGSIARGGDIRFCEKAISQGFRVAANFDILCEHYRAVHLGALAAAYTVEFTREEINV